MMAHLFVEGFFLSDDSFSKFNGFCCTIFIVFISGVNGFFMYIFFGGKSVVNPRFDVRAPPQVLAHEIDHAASTYSSRGSDFQILDFEDHAHLLAKFYTLTVRQTEHHVVIQHSIHVFDPERVYWSIEHDPVFPVCLILRSFPHYGGGEAIVPFLCERVYFTIQFSHADTFWIEDLVSYLLKTIVLGLL